MREWIGDHVKQIVGGVLVVLAAYLVVLPMCWPEPTVSAAIPDSVSLGEDLTITVTVSAWHGLFNVHNVRFFIDTNASTAKGGDEPLYPISLRSESPTRYKQGDRLRRITIPHTRVTEFTVPLAQAAADGLLGRGELTGKVDVQFTYEGGRTRWVSTRESQQSIPFTVQVR